MVSKHLPSKACLATNSFFIVGFIKMLRPDLFDDPESHKHELEQFISGLPGDRIAASDLVDEIRKLEKKDELKNGGFTKKYGNSLKEFFTNTSTRDKWKFEILLEMFIPLAEELALGFSQTMHVEQGVITDPEILTQIAIDALMQGINDYEPIDDGVSLLHFYIFLKDKMSEALLESWGTAQIEYITLPLHSIRTTKDETDNGHETALTISDILQDPNQKVDGFGLDNILRAVEESISRLRDAREELLMTILADIVYTNSDREVADEELYDKIAEATGLGIKTVKKIIKSVRNKLAHPVRAWPIKEALSEIYKDN